jgi:flagellar motor switch protein FliN/FliY
MPPLDDVNQFSDVPMTVRADLRCAPITVETLLSLKPGSLVRTVRAAGDSIDVKVGDQLIGYGEIIVIGNKLGVRLSEFVERI